jgi:exosortase/archaeosortase family protein
MVFAPSPPRRLWLTAVLFLLLSGLLQWGWSTARGTSIERLVIDQATVKTVAWLIDTLDPSIGVQASGSRLKAPGGGINILNGCDGTEVFFLLASAMVLAPLSWRARLTGLLAGGLLVFVINQGRVLALFHAHRLDRGLFDTLHGLVTPLLLIVATGAFFLFWLNYCTKKRLAGHTG